jgi:hypothetical protein
VRLKRSFNVCCGSQISGALNESLELFVISELILCNFDARVIGP